VLAVLIWLRVGTGGVVLLTLMNIQSA